MNNISRDESSERIFSGDRKKIILYVSATVSLILLVLTWIFVSSGISSSTDTEILKSLRVPGNPALPAGPVWWLIFFKSITFLGNEIFLTLFVLAAAAYFYINKRRNFAFLLIISAAGGSILELILKEIVKRPRPEIVSHLVEPYFWSFPSGHAVISIAVYMMFFIIISTIVKNQSVKILIAVLSAVMVLLIGFSRVYLGVHYPTDIIAGWSVGCFWVSLCLLWYRSKKGIFKANKT